MGYVKCDADLVKTVRKITPILKALKPILLALNVSPIDRRVTSNLINWLQWFVSKECLSKFKGESTHDRETDHMYNILWIFQGSQFVLLNFNQVFLKVFHICFYPVIPKSQAVCQVLMDWPLF